MKKKILNDTTSGNASESGEDSGNDDGGEVSANASHYLRVSLALFIHKRWLFVFRFDSSESQNDNLVVFYSFKNSWDQRLLLMP